jgi:hypothetical protein
MRMLEEQRDRRTLGRLHEVHISGGLLPTISLLVDLVEFLNGAKTTKGKRVASILEQMLELEAMTKPIKGPILADLEWRKTNPKKFKTMWEIEKKAALLNRELAKYRFIPHASVFAGGGGGASEWVTYWRRDLKEAGEPLLRLRPSEALELILRLTQIGYLNRLRRCPRCRKWLYARSRQQTYCSVKCQQQTFTQTEGWKAHRREYMRQYYHKTYARSHRSKA